MADGVEFPHINGRARDGASVKLNFFGKYWRGVQNLGYADALEKNYVYELGSNEPIATTPGQYKPEDVTIEILREYADQVRDEAKRRGRNGIGNVPFTIRVHYTDGNRPVTDILEHAEITKIANDAKPGAEALIEKWTVKILCIKRNGTYLHKRA